ncbi:hypothetical protein RDV78_01975 [Bacillota bacterium LX-D]|nr:hypothetical protein [Bacillota bacterium LX-D]
MMKKKTLIFLQLCIVFGVITLSSILYSWGSASNTSNDSMMGQGMGQMMLMQLNGASVSDLIQNQQHSQTMVQNGHSSHHSDNESLKAMHYFTTITIITLLPFIIAGSIFLVIVWLK